MEFEEIEKLSSEYLFQNYGRQNIAFTHGEGSYLYGTDGKKYLDLVAGIAVNALGYSHPVWVKRMQDQIARLSHVSNLYYVKEQAELAEKVASIMPKGLDRSLFVNSGAEANEGAMKLAVRYTKRTKVLAANNGFHGRTSASLGATGQTKYQQSFEPLISNAFGYYEYGNIESVKEKISKDTAALLIEPIQGEGGVISAKPEFYKALRDLCTDLGTLLIVDEVQTGIGRTGKWMGIDNYGVVPDIITLAKGLGGGLPIGAVVTSEEYAKVMTPGSHGTTFGGNPAVCASGCAVIDVIKNENILKSVSELGAGWIADLKSIGSDKIIDVRGKGFIIGIELESADTAKAVQTFMRDNGVLMNVCHGSVVRLIPPLILKKEQRDLFTELFRKAIA
ncbi:MAG: aspartate aminotransferase family protein [Candidatus Methanoplasma sp.]|jgi:acetylornithine aminotransferase/acetylornithine/N-succinyldiaminopimelate aminotransferase|nr:aspartate aminotransferase family protein [Candidatus Methanoplasma sp.]